jgi:uncharacterized protein (DUF1697 family)
MPKHVAFLRGINVGGHRTESDELRSCFQRIGLREVVTFRASGNVIFDADREPASELAGRIEEALATSLGYPVPVFLRNASSLRRIAEHEPFDAGVVKASAGKLQVIFLVGKPTATRRKEVLELASDEDRLALAESELYWLPSGGIRDSALDLGAIEGALGPTTMRTKNTVDQIAMKYFVGA